MTAVETVEQGQLATRPAIKPGDTVRVHVKVREGDKERIQVFEGMNGELSQALCAEHSSARPAQFREHLHRLDAVWARLGVD